jgi:L-ascorbate metabolism protein UlaG (beta-lactamase superfamily)
MLLFLLTYLLSVVIYLDYQEHGDHCDIALLKDLLVTNPKIPIITNCGVQNLIKGAGVNIETTIVEDGQKIDIKGVIIEAFGKIHAEIYETIPRCANTGI